MKKHTIIINKIDFVNHDVIHLACTKPKGFSFTPGQAVDLYIDDKSVSTDKGAFTITSLPMEHQLEFVIKIYPSHQGTTNKLQDLKVSDSLAMSDAYGYIHYRNSGLFIAAGSGITPFLSIFKHLDTKRLLKGNRLLYANDCVKDIIYKNQLSNWFGNDATHILSKEKTSDYYYGLIDKEFLKNAIEDFTQDFYLCGPPQMMDTITNDLLELGVDKGQIIAEGLK